MKRDWLWYNVDITYKGVVVRPLVSMTINKGDLIAPGTEAWSK